LRTLPETFCAWYFSPSIENTAPSEVPFLSAVASSLLGPFISGFKFHLVHFRYLSPINLETWPSLSKKLPSSWHRRSEVSYTRLLACPSMTISFVPSSMLDIGAANRFIPIYGVFIMFKYLKLSLNCKVLNSAQGRSSFGLFEYTSSPLTLNLAS
jgi:hypothetical protein